MKTGSKRVHTPTERTHPLSGLIELPSSRLVAKRRGVRQSSAADAEPTSGNQPPPIAQPSSKNPPAPGTSHSIPPEKSLHHQSGFSLIEVMVAILILGVALAGLAHGISTALASSKESEWQATAALFAAGKIETLRAEDDLENGETEGDGSGPLAGYHWKETITATDTDGLHEVVVTVSNKQSKQEIYELRTLLFQAGDEASDQAGQAKKTKHRGTQP